MENTKLNNYTPSEKLFTYVFQIIPYGVNGVLDSNMQKLETMFPKSQSKLNRCQNEHENYFNLNT